MIALSAQRNKESIKNLSLFVEVFGSKDKTFEKASKSSALETTFMSGIDK